MTRIVGLPKAHPFGPAYAARRRREAAALLVEARASGFISGASASTRVGRRVLAALGARNARRAR